MLVVSLESEQSWKWWNVSNDDGEQKWTKRSIQQHSEWDYQIKK